MGDNNFEYRLLSNNVFPFNAPSAFSGGPENPVPWNFRLSPSGQLNIGNFFVHLRVEGGAGQVAASRAGNTYFESTPSGTLSRDTILPNYVERFDPSDKTDTLRANLALRSLMMGYNFDRDWSLRFGRHRYEVGPLETAFMTNSLAQATHYSNLYLPYGYLGAEVRYDRNRENNFDQVIRRAMLSFSMIQGAENLPTSGYLGILQGQITFAQSFNDSEQRTALNDPRFSLMGYVGFRGNQLPATHPENILDPGTAFGWGLGAVYEQGWWTLGLELVSQESSWIRSNHLEASQERFQESLFMLLRPDKFRIRAAYSWLKRADVLGNNPYDPPAGQSEQHWEINAGYEVFPGILPLLFYMGANGSNDSMHVGGIGLLTSLGGMISL